MICLFCDQPLEGPTINGMHKECWEQLQVEIAAAWADDWIIEQEESESITTN